MEAGDPLAIVARSTGRCSTGSWVPRSSGASTPSPRSAGPTGSSRPRSRVCSARARASRRIRRPFGSRRASCRSCDPTGSTRARSGAGRRRNRSARTRPPAAPAPTRSVRSRRARRVVVHVPVEVLLLLHPPGGARDAAALEAHYFRQLCGVVAEAPRAQEVLRDREELRVEGVEVLRQPQEASFLLVPVDPAVVG